MHEQSKSAKRRYNDGDFHKFFSGNGIDIGGAPDPLSQYTNAFRGLKSVVTWDLVDGDAQYMEGVKDDTYDFVHSSHCLEHMVCPETALDHWLRIVKPGGYLIITVPEEDMYERGDWPSKRNDDHKHTFTIHKCHSWSPVSINLMDLLYEFYIEIEIIRLVKIEEFFVADSPIFDQTLTPNGECCIEFIVRKR